MTIHKSPFDACCAWCVQPKYPQHQCQAVRDALHAVKRLCTLHTCAGCALADCRFLLTCELLCFVCRSGAASLPITSELRQAVLGSLWTSRNVIYQCDHHLLCVEGLLLPALNRSFWVRSARFPAVAANWKLSIGARTGPQTGAAVSLGLAWMMPMVTSATGACNKVIVCQH